MTLTTVDLGQDRHIDLNLAADVIARMLDIGDHITAESHEQRASWVSAYLADTCLLARVIGSTHGRADHEEIADRLWMVCASPQEVVGFAEAVVSSRREHLLDEDDAHRLALAINRTGRSAR